MNRLPLPLLGLLAAGLAACGPRAAAPESGLAAPFAASAPAQTVPPQTPSRFVSAPPNQAVRDRVALTIGCRSEAERILTNRDRGQQLREDERDARLGADATPYTRRAETDRLGRLWERDRLAEDCVQRTTTAPAR